MKLDDATPPYVIAEIGVNHDGSADRAIELCDAARDAGADAIKLQMFDARRLLSRAARPAAYQRRAGADDPGALLATLQLEPDALARVAAHAHELGLDAIVTVFSVELVPAAERFAWDAYKIASPDLVNRPLIEAVTSTGRPLLVSTGAADAHEVAAACGWLGSHAYALMQCVSAYPTPDDAAHLGGIRVLREISGGVVGYSDHTLAVDTGGLAVAAGAGVLEKHLTHDRDAAGPDHAASLEPAALAEYVRLAHRAFAMVGPATKDVDPIERDVRSVSRQSVVAVRDLPAGHRLDRDDLTLKRPGDGVPPARLPSLVGRTLAVAVTADTPLREDDLR